MRALQQLMAGPDVADWQTFLKVQSLFATNVTGNFGPITAQATNNYQTKSDLTPTGVVDGGTFAQAVTDGFVATTGANLAGMDTDQNCGGFAGAIAAAGMNFVVRYYSSSPGKNLSAPEAQKLSAAGLNIVVVYEDGAKPGTLTADVGSQHASKALALAASVGQPAGSAIYFAVDFDAQSAEVSGGISQYFGAINTAFAKAATPYRVGIYGSGLACGVIRVAGLAKLTWLSQSTGYQQYVSFLQKADIVQLLPTRSLTPGLNVDDNIAQSAEFGAFQVGQAMQVGSIPT